MGVELVLNNMGVLVRKFHYWNSQYSQNHLEYWRRQTKDKNYIVLYGTLHGVLDSPWRVDITDINA